MISFVNALKLSVIRAFSITGRSSRAEYWWTALGVFLGLIVLSIVGGILTRMFRPLGLLVLIALVLISIAQITLQIRRLHDRNMSGWWALIALIPFGSLVLLVLSVLEGTPGVNRFGINPVEDPEGHFNYYSSKQFKTSGAYGASLYQGPIQQNFSFQQAAQGFAQQAQNFAQQAQQTAQGFAQNMQQGFAQQQGQQPQQSQQAQQGFAQPQQPQQPQSQIASAQPAQQPQQPQDQQPKA